MKGKIIGLLVLMGLCTGGWFTVQKYSDVILPNTIVNGIDMGTYDLDSFKEGFNLDLDGVVSVSIDSQSKEFTLSELGYFVDVMVIGEHFDYIIKQQSVFDILQGKSYDLTLPVQFDEEDAVGVLNTWLSTIDPEMDMRDAEVIFDKMSSKYLIKPHADSSMDRSRVIDFIIDLIEKGNDKIELNSQDFRELASIRSDDEVLNKQVSDWNAALQTNKIDMGGVFYELKPKDFKDWIVIDPITSEITVDEDAVLELAKQLSATYNTMGNPQEFETFAGNKITVPGGDFGWWLNTQLTAEAITEMLLDPGVFECKAVWRQEGTDRENPLGDSYVEISLAAQHLWLYVDGEVVHDTQIVTGKPASPTRPGVFGVTYTERNARLRGATWDVNVSYWMPFDGDIGLHDASWQAAFGGERYKQGFGSNGCVNLPPESAEIIFSKLSKGYPVVVY